MSTKSIKVVFLLFPLHIGGGGDERLGQRSYKLKNRTFDDSSSLEPEKMKKFH